MLKIGVTNDTEDVPICMMRFSATNTVCDAAHSFCLVGHPWYYYSDKICYSDEIPFLHCVFSHDLKLWNSILTGWSCHIIVYMYYAIVIHHSIGISAMYLIQTDILPALSGNTSFQEVEAIAILCFDGVSNAAFGGQTFWTWALRKLWYQFHQ